MTSDNSSVPRPFFIYTICLLGAGMVHACDIWRGGWLPYRAAPLPMNIYWTSLAFFDPLAAGLLWRHRRTGLLLTLAIIVSDVAVNSYAIYGLGYSDWLAYGSLQLQTLFLGFVAGTLPYAWRRRL
jgi:hypothetical protein